MTSEGSDQLREKLLTHLASCCHGNATSRVATSHAPGIPAMTPSFPAIAPNAVWVPYPSPPPSPTSKSAVFIPVTSPVQNEMPRIPSPVSPSLAQAPKATLTPASSPSATTKTPLWRPWWTINIELNLHVRKFKAINKWLERSQRRYCRDENRTECGFICFALPP